MGLFVAIPSTRKPTTNNTQIWHDSTQFVFFLFPPRCCLWFLSGFFSGVPERHWYPERYQNWDLLMWVIAIYFLPFNFRGMMKIGFFFCRTAFCTTRKIKTKRAGGKIEVDEVKDWPFLTGVRLETTNKKLRHFLYFQFAVLIDIFKIYQTISGSFPSGGCCGTFLLFLIFQLMNHKNLIAFESKGQKAKFKENAVFATIFL